MKKVFSWIITLGMLVSLLSSLALTAFAASATGPDGVTWQLDNAGKLTISGTGPMEDHVPAGSGWGSWVTKRFAEDGYNHRLSNVKAIEVMGDLSRIGNSAFAGCRWSLDAVIHEGVQQIGRWAFLSNEQMESVFIPASVTSIGPMAFYECGSLRDVYYGGTEAQWKAIAIDSDNENLTGAVIHYQSIAGVKPVYNTQFVDVPGGAFYEAGVIWALEHGVTTGTDATHFAPDSTCTRSQVVTFLWRAAGSPKPGAAAHPFTDVEADSYYYEPMLWAVNEGIINGMTSTTFAPNGVCTRGQVATILHRFMGSPDSSGGYSPFNDVNPDSYYYNAVLWAVDAQITNGLTPIAFAPDQSCTRGQIVTFLHRALG